jgi:putative PEP-CTERM system histidine kinase
MLVNIAVVSYGIAAISFLGLAVLLMTIWRGRMYGVALIIACLTTTIWAATLAYNIFNHEGSAFSTQIVELLRNASWSVFLLLLLGPFQKKGDQSPIKLKISVVNISLFYLLLLLSTIYLGWNSDSFRYEISFYSGIVARVALAVIGMLLVEQYYRNTPVKEQWGIKFLCLGIGGMFAYDFYLYSDAMMFRQMDVQIWTARGVVNAFVVPLIALSASRNPKWSLGISVSRSVLFHSATLFGSALYLLVMSAAGYYLRYFGGGWGVVVQVTFLFVAFVLLAIILFSGAIRSWLKVFISKHFYSYNYDYREEWLRFTRTLSMEGQGLGERSIQAVAALVESPGGLLFLARNRTQCELVSHWNMPDKIEPASEYASFCTYLETTQWVIDIQEYAENPQKYGALTMPLWIKNYPQAWLIVPLILQGTLFGFVLLALPRSKLKLNWEVIDLLKIAGSQAASYLAQEESANALMVARQFESFNRMSTFVVHDLKNLIAQLSLLLSNAEKHKNNPEFQQDMQETLDLSVQKMKLILHKLSRIPSGEGLSALSIKKLLAHTVALKAAFEPKPLLEICDIDLMVKANWDRLERVIGHLIQNAIEATPKEGKVIIRMLKQEAFVRIDIQDNGQGMSAEFIRDRLFKPFESTKSAGMGIGVFESREYINELGGQLDVISTPLLGTTFHILLPAQIN